MNWSLLDTWIVATAVVTGLACALLGNFLVLRRMSMMGDAISHAVLPGLAAAFLITGSRGSVAMLVGAAVVGVLTALFTQWISRFGKVEESAAMGVVFTGLFAAGLIMIVRAADAVDLDPGCVLYGAIEMTPLDTVYIMGFAIPRAVVVTGSVLLLDMLAVGLLYKEFRITSFDPGLATAQGIDARLMHYLLMVLVAITTVAAFESVGSILVIAMLIVPAATAHLLTDRLGPMILTSLLLSAVCSGLGHVAAITVPVWWGFSDTSTSGSISVVLGLVFLLALFFAPRHGVASRKLHQAALTLQIAREDALGALFRSEEPGAQGGLDEAALARQLVAVGPLSTRVALWQLRRTGRIECRAGVVRLTDTGRSEAQNLLRSHRLWESFLHEQVGLPLDHLHGTSEQLEHVTTPEMQEELALRTTHGERDPHGHRIPPRPL